MSAVSSLLPPHTLQQTQAMLHGIPSDIERDSWVMVAAVLHNEFGDVAFDVFDAWSSTASNYNARHARDTWRSCRNLTRYRIGSLVHLAKQHGWTAPEHRPMALSEQAALERSRAEVQKERDARASKQDRQREATQAQAAAYAVFWWEQYSAPATITHPYLKRKCIGVHGTRRSRGDGRLLVPMRDIDGRLWSLQIITPDEFYKNKRYLPHSRTSGCFHAMGEPLATADRIIIAEGAATAASLAERHRGAVVAAFSAGQLLNVGTALSTRYPAAELVIAADFDSPAGGNGGIGVATATKAAVALGAELWVPEPIPGYAKTDFNDLHVRQYEQSEMELA